MRCSELLSIISTMSHNENDILGILSFTLDNLNMLMYCDFLMAPLAAIRKILMLKKMIVYTKSQFLQLVLAV